MTQLDPYVTALLEYNKQLIKEKSVLVKRLWITGFYGPVVGVLIGLALAYIFIIRPFCSP